MFITWARLLCANFLIAIIETLILRIVFGLPPRKLFGWMIAANYFSAIVGGILLMIVAAAVTPMFRPTLFHLDGYLLAMFVVAMVMSFLLELPFVVAACGKQTGGRLRSVFACAAAQLGSYAVLLPLYLAVTQVRFHADVIPVRTIEFVRWKSASVLFLSPDDRSICRVKLDGAPPEKLMDIDGRTPHTWPDDLTVWKANDSDRWDLWLTDGWNLHVANGTGDDLLLRRNIDDIYPPQESDHFSDSVDWRENSLRDWKADLRSNAYAPHHGFLAHDATTGRDIRIVVDTPFITWSSRCPTFLPGDQVVFEIGGQIVVLDLATRKLGFIAYGHSPVVVDGKGSAVDAAQSPNSAESAK